MLLGDDVRAYPSAKERVEEPPKPFVLPPAHNDMRRVYAYTVPERVNRAVAYANRVDLERNLPQSGKTESESGEARGYPVPPRGGAQHAPATGRRSRKASPYNTMKEVETT